MWPGPWPSQPIPRFELCDLVAIALGQLDVLPSVEQPGAADRVDHERDGVTAAQNRLLLQIDRHRQRGFLIQQGNETRCLVLAHDGREQSILDGIARKDVAEGWGDHAANAAVYERVD